MPAQYKEKTIREVVRNDALDHYDRIIAFAETQPPDRLRDESIMVESIGEGWHAGDCSYCKQYMNMDTLQKACVVCPLYVATGILNVFHCCGGLWSKMNLAGTWGEFHAAAVRVREYIQRHG